MWLVIRFGLPDLSSLEVTSVPQLYFTPSPDKQQNQPRLTSGLASLIMTPCPVASQSISSNHYPEKTHLENCWIVYWDLPLGRLLKSPPLKFLGHRTQLPLHSWRMGIFPSLLPTFTFHTSKLQRPIFCLYNLFPKFISFTNDFLNKSSLLVWILTEFFPSQNSKYEEACWTQVWSNPIGLTVLFSSLPTIL